MRKLDWIAVAIVAPLGPRSSGDETAVAQTCGLLPLRTSACPVFDTRACRAKKKKRREKWGFGESPQEKRKAERKLL
jgi:ABC-type lipopolysaccharide export system ATPase subunit